MIAIKSADELGRLRRSGQVVREILNELTTMITPGVTTGEVGARTRELISARGVGNAFLGYRGFPGTVCISVNEEVVHGIPGPRCIQLGDVVSIDAGVEVDGYIGDCATTVMVGVTDPDVIRLVRAANLALEAGIEACRAGNRVGDVSNAVESIARAHGVSVVREFVGHGIGRKLHEDPQVPNYGRRGSGALLRPGMTLCIEPMLNLGVPGVRVLDDGWTAVTKDGKPSAHVEHMVAVTDGEAEILTLDSRAA